MSIKKEGCLTETRKKLISDRLNRINGQINGLKKMIEDDRYCVDILQQISSVHEALRSTAKVLMRNYLEICATNTIRSKQPKKRDDIYNEMIDVIYKFVK